MSWTCINYYAAVASDWLLAGSRSERSRGDCLLRHYSQVPLLLYIPDITHEPWRQEQQRIAVHQLQPRLQLYLGWHQDRLQDLQLWAIWQMLHKTWALSFTRPHFTRLTMLRSTLLQLLVVLVLSKCSFVLHLWHTLVQATNLIFHPGTYTLSIPRWVPFSCVSILIC